VTDERRFYEAAAGANARRSAPAALRNREPIAAVLREWLPPSGFVLEVASGTGEHAIHFAGQFPSLEWQPSDPDPRALASITAWSEASGLANVRPPLELDAAAPGWPIDHADAVLCINMVHISPWSAALGLLDGSAKVLPPGGALILYGPWLQADVPTATSNLQFDEDLKSRDPAWGLRSVETFAAEATRRGFVLEEVRPMPANNLMLLFRLAP
jgi:SAM-dependent methyltransferase